MPQFGFLKRFRDGQVLTAAELLEDFARWTVEDADGFDAGSTQSIGQASNSLALGIVVGGVPDRVLDPAGMRRVQEEDECIVCL